MMGRRMPDDDDEESKLIRHASGTLPQWRCIATHVTPHDGGEWLGNPTTAQQDGIYGVQDDNGIQSESYGIRPIVRDIKFTSINLIKFNGVP